MKKFFSGFRYGQKGFTLLELLVVIAILGVIAALVIPNFAGFTSRGQTTVCEMEERLVKTVTIIYALDNEVCPNSIDEITPYMKEPVDIMGNYSFGGTCPDCTATQDSCS